MNKTKKTWIRILSAVLIWIEVLMMPICWMEVCAQIELTSPSAILMEASTGTVLFEKNPDEVRSPASITKIMTLLLIFENLEKGKIKLEDEVVTSAHAKSMGGSQVFLEEGEISWRSRR